MTTIAGRQDRQELAANKASVNSDVPYLLDAAIEAHGGLARWNRVSSVTIDVSITGAIWHAKGQPDVLKDIMMVADTQRERVTTSFIGQDRTTSFEPDRVAVQTSDGTILESSGDPEKSFEGQTADSPWNAIHVAYFSGEALWTYLNTPFLYAQARFAKDEIDSIEVDGETWRRLKVTFPEDGGQIMTALGSDAPNTVGLVYIAAFGLDEGESIGALLQQGPADPGTRAPGHRRPGPRLAPRGRLRQPLRR